MKVPPEQRNPSPTDRARFVLDTAAILEAANLTASECLTVPEVALEIQPGGASHRRLETMLAAGLGVRMPTAEAAARVAAAAREAGNWSRLSKADVEVLALACDVRGAVLVTDDYTVLDLARRLEIATQTIRTKGIDATKDWHARCGGCGRTYAAERAGSACDVCGHTIALKPMRGTGGRSRPSR